MDTRARLPLTRGTDVLDILFVSSDARPLRGGVARCLDGWLTGLSELGYRAGIISLLPSEFAQCSRGPERMYREFLVSASKRVPREVDRIPLFRKLRTAAFLSIHYFRVRLRIKFLLRSLRPAHVVLGSIDVDSLYVLREATRIGAATSVVCYGSEFRPSATSLSPSRLAVLKATRRVLAISHATRELIQTLPLFKGEVSLVRPSLAPETDSLARQDGFPPVAEASMLRLVSLARLVERKGVQHLLDALAILRRRGVMAHLTVVGDGRFGPDLVRQASEQGLTSQVTFAGALSDEEATSVLRTAHIFVLTPFEPEPGDVEGFGLVYLEAGALGIPVIGTRSGGVPEAVLENKTGLLVAPCEPLQIADAIAHLWKSESERSRLGAAGRDWARAHSPRRAAESLVQALELRT